MKKYIKILGLATIVTIQSCEVTDRELASENQKESTTKALEKKEQLKTANKDGSTESNSHDIDTGDDDEPRRDKSHWRVAQDTIN